MLATTLVSHHQILFHKSKVGCQSHPWFFLSISLILCQKDYSIYNNKELKWKSKKAKCKGLNGLGVEIEMVVMGGCFLIQCITLRFQMKALQVTLCFKLCFFIFYEILSALSALRSWVPSPIANLTNGILWISNYFKMDRNF